MTTAETIKAENRLEIFLTQKGITLHNSNRATRITNRCPAVEHKRGHLCVTVDTEKQLWHCNDCGTGGDVITWMAIEAGKTPAQFLAEKTKNGHATSPPKQADIVATYDYYDETSQFLYQVCRMNPKSFRQRRQENGKWIWNMEGVRRVLYNLPAILNPKNRWIWIVEGERDVQTLTSVGLCATTNVGGAGKWCDAYSDALKGKEIVLCGDNDEPGRAHMKKVLESLTEKANSIRQIQVPSPHKDVTDFVQTFEESEKAGIALAALVEVAPILAGATEIPILSMDELEAEYEKHAKLMAEQVLNIGHWLPSLKEHCRGIVPGEVASVFAGTGVGKTCFLQNLAMQTRLPTLFFEMELPGSLTFERFAAMSGKVHCQQIENTYRAGQRAEWRAAGDLGHIWTCPRSRLQPENIEALINKAELKMGIRPVLVLVDYIQLIRGRGAKRYEVVSDAAEDLKVIAKQTGTIIFVASQVKRKDGDELEVSLHDAKESGSIENSSGLVLGAWRPEPDRLVIRVLKNTKGRSGGTITCKFDGETMTISELVAESAVEYADAFARNNGRNPHND